MLETAENAGAGAAGAGSPGAARYRYIPRSKREVLAAFLSDPEIGEEERALLSRIAVRLALIFHVELFAARERLKELYVRFNPDQPGTDPLPSAPEAREALLAALDDALMAANFDRMDLARIGSERDSAGRVSAKVRVPREAFDTLRLYGRGRRRRPIEVARLFGLKREAVETEVWDDVAFVAGVRPDATMPRPGHGRLRPGAVYLKLFRDIPQADLETLFPNARVVMRLRDKLILGVPAIAGGVPVALNLIPAMSVLLVVAGAWLGVSGTVEQDAMKQALGALSGLGALGGFLVRQWVKYERQKLMYQKQVAENAYFNNVNNNAGFFDTLIGQSEDSEVKEAFLAYGFLWRAGEPLGEAALDARIEAWIGESFGADVDFEIDDALEKLARLGLVSDAGEGRIAALPLEDALAATDRAWAALARSAFG